MRLSRDPEIRRLQTKNRVQFIKGAITIFFGLGCLLLFIENISQKSTLNSRRKRDIEITCGQKFEEQYKDSSPEEKQKCEASLNKTYNEYTVPSFKEGKLEKWSEKTYDYDCVYWCDTDSYPASIFSIRERKYGAVCLYIVGLLYMFMALAIVCDEYFVPALEKISEKLKLSDDVAGATFMAAGGSAPELFTSLIGAFTNSSVGIGTIVGSAVFNILFVLGACAFVVGFKIDPKTNKGTVLNLTWFPLTRDVIFYILSLGMLMWGFSENKITLLEASLMVGVYAKNGETEAINFEMC